MDFDNKFNYLRGEIDRLCNAYAEAQDFTQGFLDCCEKHGIALVSIQRKTEEIPSSINFPFGTRGSVFAEERENEWPAIWSACEEYNISGGAGNVSQHQISGQAQSKLIDGVYRLKGGKWFKEE